MRRLLTTLTLLFAAAGPLAPEARAAWQWPVSGDVITPYRNGTDPYASGQHRGIDIAAPVGPAVRAAAGGGVRFAGTAGSSGLTVSVRTGDGYDTSYLHLSSLSVREGARVAMGDRLGAVGTSGSRSVTAAHLHFGVRTAESRHAYHDPLRFLQPPPAASRPPAAPPAPAPDPARAPQAAAPAPATPIPASGALPAPSPAGRRAGTPRDAPGRAHRPAIREAPAPGHALRPVPGHTLRPARLARAAPSPVPAPTGSPSPAAAGAPRPGLSPAPSAERRHSPTAGSTAAIAAEPRPAGDHGPNVGWALACAGLLLAAGVLGLSEDGRRSTRRASRAFARLIPTKDPA